ncbi:MAG: exosortase [Alphaproteobacteria bacterium]|nr:exosortase [Alphaproteobacteria bacterium]
MTAAGLDTRPAMRTAGAQITGRDLRLALPPLILALAAFAFVFQAEVAAAVRVWIDSRAYNHGFLVLPIALWLAWDRRRRAQGLALRPTLWPLLAIIPLGFGWFVAERLGIMEGRQLAALFMLQALLVAWLGWDLARAFAAPIAYLIFLVPFGAFITPALQSFTARFIDVGLAVIGIPHVVTNFTIEIPEGTFYVAEACAGLRFLIATIAFGALYAALIYRSAGRRIAFLLACLVVPVIANGFRALGIVVLGHVLGSAEAADADHLIYGWGFFSVVLLLLIAAGLPFRQDTPGPATAPARRAGDGMPLRAAGPWAAAVLAAVLAAAGPAAAALLSHEGTAPRLALPGFVATAACLGLGDAAGPVQHFSCNGAGLTATVRVLPAGASPGALRAAIQDATGERGAEEVETATLAIPGATPRVWRLTTIETPPRVVATAAFVDGVPAAGGLAARARLAWQSLAGGGGPVVVVAAALEPASTPSGLDAPGARDAARGVLRSFLAAQAPLLQAAARASAAPAGHPGNTSP